MPKVNQEVTKYLAKTHAIPESSLEQYAPARPQGLEVKDSNIFLDGIIIDSGTAKVYESWGYDMNFVTPENVRNALDKFNEDITMWINSPGGSVFDASSILTTMMRYQENHKINVVVDGLCASAATYLAVHGDDRKIAKMSMFMIHNSWAFGVGDADDLRRVADTLNKIDGSYASMMADKSKLTEDEVRAAMKEETWYSAAEAVEHGFMDFIFEPKKASQSTQPKSSPTQRLTATVLALNELRGY